MKCPDCGTRLSDIAIDGQFLYRCYHCGGFWGDAHLFENISPHSLVSMRRVKIDQAWLKGGSGVCPTDGMVLQEYVGEDVPDTVRVKSCMRCNKRWYAGDSLFVQKLAGNTIESKPASVPRVLFVVAVGVFLAGALASSVSLVNQTTRISTQAASEVKMLSLTYQNGIEEVVFESTQTVKAVSYREQSGNVWTLQEVEALGNKSYRVMLPATEGSLYVVEILGQEFNFEAK